MPLRPDGALPGESGDPGRQVANAGRDSEHGAVGADARARTAAAVRRRVFCLVLLALAWPVAAPAQDAGAAAAGPPNVIFILADDLGWNDVGYHGGDIRTPSVDRMAREGATLERHYVHPYCLPTRLALLTGRYPSRMPLRRPATADTVAIGEGVLTLQGALGRLGYRTHIAGKWHLGGDEANGPLRYGFDSSYGALSAHADPIHHDTALGQPVWHRDDRLVDEEGHATDLITDDALAFLSRHDDDRFFLYVAYTAPHWPLHAAERWVAPYRDADLRNPDFAAMVTHMDSGIGRILQRVEALSLSEQTLIVFASDNGAESRSGHTDRVYEGVYGERYGVQSDFGDNSPLRGSKGTVYEGGIRVPAVAYWPGRIPPSVISSPMQIEDWLPTIVGLAGGDLDGWDGPGEDLGALLRGESEGSWEREFYTRSAWPQPMWSLRQGSRKLVVKVRQPFPFLQKLLRAALPASQEWRLNGWFGNADYRDPDRIVAEMFDVRDDPSESEDILRSSDPAQVRAMLERLNALRALDSDLDDELCIPDLG